jgi:predicted dehydrogenase
MKEVRVGVIGAGGMGQNHMDSIKSTSRAKLAAICDMNKEHIDKVAEKFETKAFYDAEEMFKSGEIDAVLIATPHYSHTPLTIKAFESGIHVLVEKPIAVHKADAQKMVEAHKNYPELKFAAMFNQRTLALYKKIKFLIDNGEIGKVMRVNWIITNWFRSQTYYNSGGWRATWKGEGGGVLLNQCPHQLDLFQWLFGLPVKVRAFASLGKYHEIEVEDDVTAYCEFENGATGVFISSTGEAPGTNRLEVTGDRGRIVVEDGKIKFDRTEVSVSGYIKNSPNGFGVPEIWNVEVPAEEPPGKQHQRIIENFVNAILDDSDLIAKGEEGIRSVEFGNAMLYSALKDVTVDMPLDGDAYEKMLQSLIENSTFKKKEVKEKADEDFSKSFNAN